MYLASFGLFVKWFVPDYRDWSNTRQQVGQYSFYKVRLYIFLKSIKVVLGLVRVVVPVPGTGQKMFTH